MLIKIPRGWEIPEREATSESTFWNRRQILKAAGFVGLGGMAEPALRGAIGADLYPAKLNTKYKIDRLLTPYSQVTGYNNFYEFTTDKERVKDLVGKFKIDPWKVTIKGLVNKPGKFDLDDLVRRFPLEERLYRLRCVEAWSMAVPWTGFPISALIKAVEPKPEAQYMIMTTAQRLAEMPGILSQDFYPWPYQEVLRIDEAMNELAMFVTGVFGKPLPKQNGAPIRLITPWKYGLKSIKSIVEIRFVKKRSNTFWHAAMKDEYGWYSNVNPARPHVRWSQAQEKFFSPKGIQMVRTLPYNGYEEFVGSLYTGEEF